MPAAAGGNQAVPSPAKELVRLPDELHVWIWGLPGSPT